MQAGQKIEIPVFKYHVTYYKPSRDGNLTYQVYDSPEEAECRMREHVIAGYQIFNFTAEVVHKKTDFVIQ